MRPSRMIELLKKSDPDLKGDTLTSDDEAGLLKVKGKAELVDQLEAYIAIPDIKPRQIELDIYVDSPIDCNSNHVVAEVANNAPYNSMKG